MLLLLLACSLATADAPDFARCTGLSEPQPIRELDVDGLDEASGLAVGQRDGKVLWTHNDHGDKARLFAIGRDGKPLGELRLKGIEARDWEDIAAGTLDGKPVLFVADTGNNDLKHRKVTVVRVDEPAPDGSIDRAVEIELRWPDAIYDVESLGFDPVSKKLLLATKERRKTRFFVAPVAPGPDGAVDLEPIGALELEDFGKKDRITAADFTPDGSVLYLRSQDHVLRFSRKTPTEPMKTLLAHPPCSAPSPDEPDAEALAATATGYLTVSEGEEPTLFEVR